ncbi:hypothetical protein HNQ91_003945 [Filimonas zeae]|uniref:Uncharacterized protein n=1 Tax=Filimonas zeae TaxID=1737353 RepID=A0A917MY48_9BACT|nr:hypothetical protein [Filimonas zeae]MDR6340872.1 hypothetical protein [Filimonas zeae]GGH78121.1 hypothetical protein GCM10011379_45520 [Filimonas zeae]
MTDLILDEFNDLLISETTGDFVLGESDVQHQQLLLLCSKGAFKESPDTCVGAFKYLESENPAALLREVRLQFSADGMEVGQVVFENKSLKVKASYL